MKHYPHDIWFPAKRYGYGWGLPVKWQGWVALVGYFGLLIWGTMTFLYNGRPLTYTLFVFFISSVLIGLCWLKGEEAKWRWGDK